MERVVQFHLGLLKRERGGIKRRALPPFSTDYTLWAPPRFWIPTSPQPSLSFSLSLDHSCGSAITFIRVANFSGLEFGPWSHPAI
uniref:Uncharacterized protein n=1 Tax=Nelumbo nucifera TaxID=4432 RepID=A0A822YVX0_NELNU|nr:TPA_asm: hypothetical protein HUJ06_005905 [Nelumbo nucifera]